MRPRNHFAPAKNWMNDPNGMVYYKGKYHLFFQYSPESDIWKDISWGHAVSSDLVHWEELPIALLADEAGLIFSGSAVVDYKNTSGFGTLENPPMVAIYTNVVNDIQSQALAFSLDEGLTWEKYSGNPVLDLGLKDFRDPKVSWHEESQSWIMALALPDLHKIAFYTSPDLKQWEKLSEFGPAAATGGVWECPDLFALATSTGERKWLLIVSLNPGGPQGGSATQYFIGDFDGRTFTADDLEERWIDYGKDFYAAVTFDGVPDGERILIGWCNNWDYARDIPALPYRGEMALPRKLTLEGRTLISRPAIELKSSLITVDFENEYTTAHGVAISRVDGSLILDRSKSSIDGKRYSTVLPSSMEQGSLKLEIYEDIHSVEIFINGGAMVLTYLNFVEG